LAKKGMVWAAVLGVSTVVLAACGSSPSSSPPTSTTAIAPAAALATGSYVPPGASGTPHYVVTIGSAQGNEFGGTLNFVYQDGTSSRVFNFSGTVTGQKATATPTDVAESGSGPKTVSTVPVSLRIDVAPETLTFTGCQGYLPEVRTPSACTFTMSR
jgi:hypothetical protein